MHNFIMQTASGDQKDRVATIVGQGYVGMPLAQGAARAGWKVYGFDVTQSLVDALNSGISHIDDLSDDDIQEMLSLGYVATTDPKIISISDVIVVCVPTPLGEAGSPDLGAVEAATRSIGLNLTKNATVILESTTYPGTTENLVLPILESKSGLKAGKDFYLAFSPERIDPGSKNYGIKNTPKLVGGIDNNSTEKAAEFYRNFVNEVVPLKGAKEAETAKLLENTFRHVNIALVNEMAKFCKELDIDIWEVIRGASTKPFGFMKFTPGPGVGGHCIPIDPNYLSYEVRKELGYPFHFVELAQEINSSMPSYIVNRAAELLNNDKKPLNGSTVLLLGVTYKADIADQRESPAIHIGNQLRAAGANVLFHDPLVHTWHLSAGDLDRVADLDRAAHDSDLVILLQAHRAYDLDKLTDESKIFFDTRGVAPEGAVRL